jgi:AcrR family transcriptional regulator
MKGLMRRTQEQRSAETTTAISDATIRCLIAKGYAGTTMASVAETAGISRGAVTHHFSSKQEMLIAAVEHLARRTETELREASEQIGDEDRLTAVLQLLWKSFRGDLFSAAHELWTAARTDPVLHEALSVSERRLGRRHLELISDLIGPDIALLPNFDLAIDTTLNLMRGMAVTGIVRDDESKEQQLLDGWVHAFAALAATQTTRTGK